MFESHTASYQEALNNRLSQLAMESMVTLVKVLIIRSLYYKSISTVLFSVAFLFHFLKVFFFFF